MSKHYISRKEKLIFLLGDDYQKIKKVIDNKLSLDVLEHTNFNHDELKNIIKDKDRYKEVYLDPNFITKEQVKNIPKLDKSLVEQVIMGAPYYSMRELAVATNLSESILSEIFKIDPYKYKDKLENKIISLSPVYGHYIIPSSKEREFESLQERTNYKKTISSTSSFMFNVIKLDSDFESSKNFPHLLKKSMNGKVYPILSDEHGYKKIFVPFFIDVWFKKGIDNNKIEQIVQKNNLKIEDFVDKINYYKVFFKTDKKHIDITRMTFELIDKLHSYDEVLFAEPTQVGFNDFEQESNLNELDFESTDKFWFYYETKVDLVHKNITKGSKDVTIAVIDTGCRMDHVYLKNKFDICWKDLDLDFVHDSADEEMSPNQITISHGTKVAGVVAKIAPECNILPLKVSAWYGGRAAAIRSALLYCQSPKRIVINISWKTDGEHIGIREALKEAKKRGAVVVASAGNYGRQMKNEIHFPSGYVWIEPVLDNLCSVGATAPGKRKASYSYFGDKSVTFAAPGGEVGGAGTSIYSTSTQSKDSYEYSAGTSFSAPHIAGISALMLSEDIELDADKIINILKNSSENINDMREKILGSGIVDAYRALSEVTHKQIENIVQSKKLNINLVTYKQLLKIPNLGSGLSKEIIEYRQKHGKYISMWELSELYIQDWFIYYLSKYLYCE